MRKLSPSIKIYIGLIIILAALAAINVFLPQGSFLPILPEQELPAPKPVLSLVNAAIMLRFGVSWLEIFTKTRFS